MNWLRAWLKRGQVEREMDEELRFHIDAYAADLVKQGMTAEAAARKARMAFGGLEARKEECRESLGLRLWDELKSDLRGGVRVLRQSPIFTAVAVVSLALGIGANTAIFSLANEVLLRTMAVPDAARLRLFTWARGKDARPGPAWGSFFKTEQGEMAGTPFPYPLYREMQRYNTVMEELVGFKDVYQLSATVNGQPESVDGILVSGNFYQGIGARVEAGRALVPSDDVPNATPVAVISDAYWQQRFGRSAAVLGQTIELNRLPVTIVGVNAAEFVGPKAGTAAQIFFPLSLQQQVIPNQKGSLLSQESYWWVLILGRLKPGVTEAGAEAALKMAFRNAFHATITDKKEKDIPRFFLSPGERGLDFRRRDFSKPIYLLLTVAGVVLLIACANLANMLLARASARQREVSLRLAMGAGRGRIMRQMLTEAMLLSLLGGLAGLLLAWVGRNAIPSLFASSWRPSELDVHLDSHVFLFALVLTVLTGILFGVGPAWQATKTDANAALKETSRMSTGRSKALLGKALVVLQVALSLMLVVGAGLFVRTLLNLRSVPTGLNPEHILLFQVNPPKSHYSVMQRVVLFQQIIQGLKAIPGAQMVTSSSEPLLAESMDNDCFRASGNHAAGQQDRDSLTNFVGADFFETYGIPILNGRSLTLRDGANAPKVAVINETLAREFFPHKNPVGQTISTCDAQPKLIQVVGVSKDAKYSQIRGDVPRTIYMPFAQSAYLQSDNVPWMTFEVKTAASVASMVPNIRNLVKALDRNLPVLDVRTQTEQIDATLTQERMFASLTGGFGLLALGLASIGIYGVMAYTVSRRTNEIGIRMALGAHMRGVLGMVLGETAWLAAAGIAIGLAGAWAATRVVESMLFGVKARDAGTFLGGAGILLTVALIAAAVPAWRAAKVDPMVALRHE